MRKRIALVILWILTVINVYAQDTIRGSYVYTYGDSESLVKARQTCKDLAIRDAIESYYIFVESSTEVENAMLKEDIINTLSAGYLKNLTVVDQNEEGRTISTTVEAKVNPEEVQALVQKIAESSQSTVSSGSETIPSSADTETLESLLDHYDAQMVKIEADWNNKNYISVFDQVQALQKKLESLSKRGATPFQKNLYLCVHKRTVLIKHLVGLEQAEQQAHRKIYTRSEAKQVAQDVLQLKDAMIRLKNVKVETDKQNHLRDVWLNRCQATIDRVKKRAALYKNRD